MKHTLINIPITKKAYAIYAAFYGNDRVKIGEVVSRAMIERADRIERLNAARKSVNAVSKRVEVLLGLDDGYILSRHIKTGRLIRGEDRSLYRYIVAIIVNEKYGFNRSEVMAAIGIKHSNFTYGVDTLNCLYDCYPVWRKKLNTVNEHFRVKIRRDIR